MEKFKKQNIPLYLRTGVWVFVLCLIAGVMTLILMIFPTLVAMYGGAYALGIVSLISIVVGFIILGWVFMSMYHNR